MASVLPLRFLWRGCALAAVAPRIAVRAAPSNTLSSVRRASSSVPPAPPGGGGGGGDDDADADSVTADEYLRVSALMDATRYEKLEGMALGEDELPQEERQARRQGQQASNRKAADRDFEDLVRRRHGRNAEFVLRKLQSKQQGAWHPRRKVSRPDMERIRLLHAQYPLKYTKEHMAFVFGISRQAVARVLHSKWAPDARQQERQRRQPSRGADAAAIAAGGADQSIGDGRPARLLPQQPALPESPPPPPQQQLSDGAEELLQRLQEREQRRQAKKALRRERRRREKKASNRGE